MCASFLVTSTVVGDRMLLLRLRLIVRIILHGR